MIERKKICVGVPKLRNDPAPHHKESRTIKRLSFIFMHKVYILYSNTFDKFYVGETQNIAVRLEQHNQGFYQNSFTGFTNDWILQLELTVSNRVEARTIERYIKSMKSKNL